MERAGDGAAARAVKLVEALTGKNPPSRTDVRRED
jgi:hypothetical protein